MSKSIVAAALVAAFLTTAAGAAFAQTGPTTNDPALANPPGNPPGTGYGYPTDGTTGDTGSNQPRSGGSGR